MNVMDNRLGIVAQLALRQIRRAKLRRVEQLSEPLECQVCHRPLFEYNPECTSFRRERPA